MTSEYSKEITDALERLRPLHKLYDEERFSEYIEQLNDIYEEFCELGMEQNILIRRGECFHALEKLGRPSACGGFA